MLLFRPWYNEKSWRILLDGYLPHSVHIEGYVVFSWEKGSFYYSREEVLIILILTCKFQTTNLFGTSFVWVLPHSHCFLFYNYKFILCLWIKHNDLPKVLNLHDVAVFVPNHDVSFSFIQHSIQQQQHLHTTINNGKYRSLAFFNLVSYFLFNICKCIRVCRIHGAGKHEILKKIISTP